MKENTYCPYCGRNMDKLENGKIDGHTWYRDDSDYIQNIERSRGFLIKQHKKLKELCRDIWKSWEHCNDDMAGFRKMDATYLDEYKARMEELGLLGDNDA